MLYNNLYTLEFEKNNMNKSFFIFSLSISSLFSLETTEPLKSPEEIQLEINQAENDFKIAEAMFNPWYTGPLIASSASTVPPGQIMLQPYLYLTTNYAQFNEHRKSINTPNTFIMIPLLAFETGITNWMDITIVPQGFFRWESGKFGDGFGDFPVQLGFQLYNETPYIPKMRLVVGTLFPTGKYQHLNAHKLGLDATGQGAYQTILGLNISKVLWWFKLHPIATRLATSYTIPDHRVSVKGFNAFGGGYHTNGNVKIGSTLTLDLGVEVSITQRWVFATDVVYTTSSKTTFSGNPGITSDGLPASNGSPSSDQFSLAPAIEYNLNENAGFIGGVWFTVTGRNSANFVSVLLSYTIVI